MSPTPQTTHYKLVIIKNPAAAGNEVRSGLLTALLVMALVGQAAAALVRQHLLAQLLDAERIHAIGVAAEPARHQLRSGRLFDRHESRLRLGRRALAVGVAAAGAMGGLSVRGRRFLGIERRDSHVAEK